MRRKAIVSTFENQINHAERKRGSDELTSMLREVLIHDGTTRHAQVGVIFVIENGQIVGLQTVNTRTKASEHLTLSGV